MLSAGRTLSVGELIDETSTVPTRGTARYDRLPVYVLTGDGEEHRISEVSALADRILVAVDLEQLDHDESVELYQLRTFVEELAQNKRTKAGKAAATLLAELEDGPED